MDGSKSSIISIHALLAESDKLEKYGIKMQGLFLSTLSLRRATLELFLYYQDNTISIHALLAESDAASTSTARVLSEISIHALLAESDSVPTGLVLTQRIFLSTLSLRRATRCRVNLRLRGHHFYPRSPCGERLAFAAHDLRFRHISIHALLAESDLHGCYSLRYPAQFLSTLSLRRATTPL